MGNPPPCDPKVISGAHGNINTIITCNIHAMQYPAFLEMVNNYYTDRRTSLV